MSSGTAGPTAKAEPRNARAAPSWLRRLVNTTPPYSIRSLAVAVLCFACALVVQLIFRAAGGSLLFATYFPAVLVAGLLAGVPAGAFVTVMGLVTVWWAFIPPRFGFFPLGPNHLLDMATYLVSTGCILFVTEHYRDSLRTLLRQEQERELLMKELEHRAINTYAVIDVIVRKTLEDDPDRANILSGRIRAVKFANVLLEHTAGYTALLKTLLLHEFVAYGESRFQVDGPDIELPADVARRLALVFHELATNAAKYGALSQPGGRVLIAWKNEGGVVRLEWREEGGPPVRPPEKHGFGSRIVTETLTSLSGSIAPTFAPEGLRCTMTFRV